MIREEPLTIAGCTYNGGKSNASGEIGPDGLVLNLYYDRNLYAYTVEYLEAGTEKKLLDDKASGAAYRYGKLVSEKPGDLRIHPGEHFAQAADPSATGPSGM